MLNNQVNSSALDRHGQIDQVIGHLQLLRSSSQGWRPSDGDDKMGIQLSNMRIQHGNFMGISWGYHGGFHGDFTIKYVGNDWK